MKKYHCKLAITLLFISSISHGLTLKNNDFSITIEPETLKIAHENEVINKGIQQRTTQKIKATDDKASWYWPDRQMNVSARLEGQQLRLRFTTSQVQTFFGINHLRTSLHYICHWVKVAIFQLTILYGNNIY
ncbi:hypothetical protein AB6H14_08565 [Providencia vermicola]